VQSIVQAQQTVQWFFPQVGKVQELDQLTLARACKKRDAAALEALVNRYGPQVHALVARMLVRSARHEVDDVTQDVLVKVITALPRFDVRGPAKLSTWILTIATRTCIDRLRRPRRVEPLDFDTAAPEDLQRSTEQRELYEQVTRAMAELVPEQRAVLVLRAYHDLDTAEIAEALRIEPGTVKSRLSRARAALRSAVEQTKRTNPMNQAVLA
jgi:RNA polymerase sigma-70 factor (ECF subfamily)